MQAKGTDDVDLRVRRRLRELRTQRGLTLDEVATRAGIDVSTLSRLESQDVRPAPHALGSLSRRGPGRPRSISDEKVAAMRNMYAAGRYSHADIALHLQVSKASVAHYLAQKRAM